MGTQKAQRVGNIEGWTGQFGIVLSCKIAVSIALGDGNVYMRLTRALVWYFPSEGSEDPKP